MKIFVGIRQLTYLFMTEISVSLFVGIRQYTYQHMTEISVGIRQLTYLLMTDISVGLYQWTLVGLSLDPGMHLEVAVKGLDINK